MKVEERIGLQPRLPLGESSVATNEDDLTDEERSALARKRGLFLRLARKLSNKALNDSRAGIIANYFGDGTERITFRDKNGKPQEIFVTIDDIDWVLKAREQGRRKKR